MPVIYTILKNVDPLQTLFTVQFKFIYTVSITIQIVFRCFTETQAMSCKLFQMQLFHFSVDGKHFEDYEVVAQFSSLSNHLGHYPLIL